MITQDVMNGARYMGVLACTAISRRRPLAHRGRVDSGPEEQPCRSPVAIPEAAAVERAKTVSKRPAATLRIAAISTRFGAVHFSGRTTENRQHYLGFSSDLQRRYGQHRSGWGANETRKTIAEGLTLTVAQTWKGTPALERRLKEWSRDGRRGFYRICPLCPRQDDLPPDLTRALGSPSMRVYCNGDRGSVARAREPR